MDSLRELFSCLYCSIYCISLDFSTSLLFYEGLSSYVMPVFFTATFLISNSSSDTSFLLSSTLSLF